SVVHCHQTAQDHLLLLVVCHSSRPWRANPVLSPHLGAYRVARWPPDPMGDNRTMKRSGVGDLPLHGGRVPAWLAGRMTELGTAIVESILLNYGHSAFLSRLSDPYWFQALGSVMGMDWHSSGITTSVIAALKRGINSRASDLELYVCGGRGHHSRNTP